MATFEVRINTHFGSVAVHLDSADQFAERIKELDVSSITRAVRDHFSGVVLAPPRQTKPALSGICAFRPDGSLEFLKPPKEKLEAIGLALYAFDPDPLPTAAIGAFAAVQAPSRYLRQKRYHVYF